MTTELQERLEYKFKPWLRYPATADEYHAALKLLAQPDLDMSSREVEDAWMCVMRWDNNLRYQTSLRERIAPQREARMARLLRNSTAVGAVCIDSVRDLWRLTDGHVVPAEWVYSHTGVSS